MSRLTAVFGASLLGLISPLLVTSGTLTFDPVFDVFVSSPAPSANSNVRIMTRAPAGDYPVGAWSVTLPAGWDIQDGNLVTDGDVVARGTMSIDTDCDGIVNTYGPFDLVDLPLSPQSPVAEWSGSINSWWDIIITADREPSQPFDLSVFLPGGIKEPHTLCAPQTFVVNAFGRSSPHNDAVITNPSAGSYTWTGTFGSLGGGLMKNVSDLVCVGNSCDSDGDGDPDVQDNCPSWPNQAQNLPPWLIPANDPDCDGFGSDLEDHVGTNALVHCGTNTWAADITNNTFSDVADISPLTGNFGASVPPASDRYNIAPDPPLSGPNFIDTADIAKMTGFFARTCAPCAGDLDCDAVADVSDNCPNWPNPLQNLPPWTLPPNDPDCDGFSTALENSVGTNPLAHCGTNAWPADVTDNTFSDIGDISFLTGNFGAQVPPAPARYNIAPDPPMGPPNFIDTADIAKMTGFFGQTCV